MDGGNWSDSFRHFDGYDHGRRQRIRKNGNDGGGGGGIIPKICVGDSGRNSGGQVKISALDNPERCSLVSVVFESDQRQGGNILFWKKKEKIKEADIWECCAKCGIPTKGSFACVPSIRYHRNGEQCPENSNTTCQEEHLHFTCSRCGYDWVNPVVVKN